MLWSRVAHQCHRQVPRYWLVSLFYMFRENERNGVGIIIASAILLPLVWTIALVRRLIWRFLLRP